MRQSSSRRRVAGGSGTKPPVLLYFSGHDTAEIGYASAAGSNNINSSSSSSSSPKHVAPLPPLAVTPAKSAADAQQIFLRYAQPLADLFSRLAGSETNKNRRVVVLHAQGPYANRWWRLAVARILHNVVNVPAEQHVAFVSTLQVVPVLLALLPPATNSKKSTTCCLTVCLTATEAQCMVYAMGHSLDYTYQSCGYSLWDNDDKNLAPRTVQELQSRQRKLLLLPNNSSNNMLLLRAICQSLQECPVALRRTAIHNIVVAGAAVVDSFGAQLARQLYQFLNDTEEETKQDSKSETDDVPTNASSSSVVWTGVAVHKTALKPLSEHIAVIDFAGAAPSALPWMAASLWALQQQQQQQHASTKHTGPQPAATTMPTAWNELASEIEL